jgi:hypothetical protein
MLIKATHRLEIAANSPLFKLALVLVRFDHIASVIVNAYQNLVFASLFKAVIE